MCSYITRYKWPFKSSIIKFFILLSSLHKTSNHLIALTFVTFNRCENLFPPLIANNSFDLKICNSMLLLRWIYENR